MDLVIATKNPGKIREIRDVIGMPGLALLTFEDFEEWPELVESSDSLEGNATIKAEALRDFLGVPALADDSGLLVDHLGGRPGARSSRYAGPEGDSERNMDLLLRELEGVGEERRGGRFVCVIALALPGGETVTTRGECAGTILAERRGAGGFGYDQVFRPQGFDRSMAELSLEEKNAISHRGAALRAIRPIIEKML